ncbi:penicillin-binding transpeptidase domain-containing protein [Mycolicibacterium diernhoferi]|uniref:Penicillin-binding protein n=3 Tax=Mycolicibacterium diernhoferi TaxID=1801 RepID=A0A1Q4H994_9MYCO|nr:penicillin-binding transpeptidase domain-containing protein [Mycolicibacterium diernhoferi]OJZ64129.1 penicillin-binding protein [Mycolicibacterium diernhoferi]PEG55263.1 penicillin-binding protein [Mycolicibacterium diernhoferi]QYL21714.1 penicillin-binding protein [Mycolicibacterium diernhoferi]
MGSLRGFPAVLLTLVLVLAGCADAEDRLNTTLAGFAEALNRGDAAAAAALTSEQAAATGTLDGLYASLGTDVRFEVSQVRREEDAATFTLAATWRFGPEKQTEWAYTTEGTAAADGDDWKIRWNPATVAPGLAAGALSYSTLAPQPAARVLDRTGADLLTQHIVTLVDIAPGVDVNAVAALLNPIAPTITADSLAGQLAAGRPVTAVTLREEDLTPIREQLAAQPDVTLRPQTRLLATDRALTSPALAGLSDLWQQRTDAAAGWAVTADTASGPRRVGGQDAEPVGDIAATLDIGMQLAAEAALAPLVTPAALVAIQPSTGELLAVAQNAPADAQGPIALTGLYPPGSTFKTVTVSAALQAGQVTPDSIVGCPGTENIEGRQIPNDDNFALGDVPLHTAFARSCNTTMGRLAVNLPPDGLTEAAAQLGLGIDYVAPGMTTVTGSVPIADSPALRVEAGIGQGKVTASPFGMALVAATLARGSVPAPTIVAGAPGVADRTPEPLPGGVDEQVRAMMRETVTGGTATALQDIPDLLGKTGTAEYIDDTHAHGWFVGIRGDLALAVFVSDAGSSAPAVDAAGGFLRASA